MIQYKGLIITPGFAYGKVYKINYSSQKRSIISNKINQLAVLEDALIKSTAKLEEQIRLVNIEFSETVSIIFEAHKLMANDPVLLDRTKELIKTPMSAYDAYKLAANEVMKQFEALNNEYMRNRIIDIEDATDRVLAAILDSLYEHELTFSEPRIVIMEKLKPSIIINCHKKHVLGFVSQMGAYNQHSGTIARIKDIPGMIVSNIFDTIKENDFILLDAIHGYLYINPTEDFVNQYLKKGDEL